MAKKTLLLPPSLALRVAWALTGEFSDDSRSQEMAKPVRARLNQIAETGKKENGKQGGEKGQTGGQGDATNHTELERRYINWAITAIAASLRSLEIAYKGREINFKENETLRTKHLEMVMESLEYSRKTKELLQSVPAMAVSSGGGATVASLISESPGFLAGMALAFAGLGHIVYLLHLIRTRRHRLKLYVKMDYERNLYYDQYLDRAETILRSLHHELKRLHREVFGEAYPDASEEPDAPKEKDIAGRLIDELRPNRCPHIHSHMAKGLVMPQEWAYCETQDRDLSGICRHWGVDRLTAL